MISAASFLVVICVQMLHLYLILFLNKLSILIHVRGNIITDMLSVWMNKWMEHYTNLIPQLLDGFGTSLGIKSTVLKLRGGFLLNLSLEALINHSSQERNCFNNSV